MIRRGWISAIALGLIGLGLIGLGFSLPQRGSVGDGAAASSKELLETTKDLRVKQQQAVDQLQVVQDQLGAQKAETKKLSEQIAVLTERLDALRQSIATKSR
jgi:hypothetical protein